MQDSQQTRYTLKEIGFSKFGIASRQRTSLGERSLEEGSLQERAKPREGNLVGSDLQVASATTAQTHCDLPFVVAELLKLCPSKKTSMFSKAMKYIK